MWPQGLQPTAPLSMESLSENTGMSSHSLLQAIFPTQGLNWGLLHCREILYCLSHQRTLINNKRNNLFRGRKITIEIKKSSHPYKKRKKSKGFKKKYLLRAIWLKNHMHAYITSEHGLVCQNKNQIPQQSVSPIRKFAQASYPYPSEGRENENHNHGKLAKQTTWITTLPNSMKLWAILCRARENRQVMVESFDRT